MPSSSVCENATTLQKPRQLIAATLNDLRQQNTTGSNPLYPALQHFARQLKSLPAEHQALVSQLLMAEICQTPDLPTRFVLRLMSDLSDAICEGRELPYLTQPQGF
ncbi:MAG: hypothetical protein IGS03_16110 [Candidatus Sericytochromatia bacterium]|nr:hypothetical protein [Candidatus Sericytochromatia bacterium]